MPLSRMLLEGSFCLCAADSLPPRLLQLLEDLETGSQEMEDKQQVVDDLRQGIQELDRDLHDK